MLRRTQPGQLTRGLEDQLAFPLPSMYEKKGLQETPLQPDSEEHLGSDAGGAPVPRAGSISINLSLFLSVGTSMSKRMAETIDAWRHMD